MLYDKELIERLVIKHARISRANSVAINRDTLIKEYEEITGIKIPYGTLSGYINAIDKKQLREKCTTLTFNERTEKIIDDPTPLATPDDLLIAVGLDPLYFELSPHNVTNRWWTESAEENKRRLKNGQLKIGFRERQEKITKETLENWLNSVEIEPFFVDKGSFKGNGLLELGLADLHFDGNTNYQSQLAKFMRWIESQKWEEVLILLGGDLFDSNNSEGLTVKGTKVNHNLSLLEMFKEADSFYKPLLKCALEHSQKVKVVYLQGNHDKDLAFAYAYGLSRVFPQIQWDIEEKVFKAHIYKDCFIGLYHGDKPKHGNQLSKLYFQLFKNEIAKAKVIELHSQHYHHEKSKDDMGFMLRSLPSAKPMSEYEYENGYVGANKRFQAFIFGECELEAILYI